MYRETVTTFEELYLWRDKFLGGHYHLLVIIGGKGLSKSYMFEQALEKSHFSLAEFERVQASHSAAKQAAALGNEIDGGTHIDPAESPTIQATVADMQLLLAYPYLNASAAVIGGVASAVDIYKKLYRYQDKPIVIDDVDKLLTKTETVSMLKQVCQKQKDGRTFVQWNKQNTVMRQEGIPVIAEASRLHLWKPEDSIDPRRRLLIGAATWSLYDLSLLDVLNEAVQKGNPAVDRVDVFDLNGVTTPVDFENYIPGLGNVVGTPVAGFWGEGVLRQRAFGWQATQMICVMCKMKLDWNRGEWRWDVRWLE